MESDNNKNLKDTLASIADLHQEFEKSFRNDSETFWKSLTEEQRLMAFFSVVDRIYTAEVVDQGSYRYALYQIFGFGPEGYGIGMSCGYMEIHNLLHEAQENAKSQK